MSRRQSRRGANAIEFALILPALVAVIFGMVEYSWYFNRHLIVSAAARDAARDAAMILEDSNIDAATVASAVAAQALPDYAQDDELTVTVGTTGASPNRIVVVTVSHPYASITGNLLPVPATVESTFSLRMEEQL